MFEHRECPKLFHTRKLDIVDLRARHRLLSFEQMDAIHEALLGKEVALDPEARSISEIGKIAIDTQRAPWQGEIYSSLLSNVCDELTKALMMIIQIKRLFEHTKCNVGDCVRNTNKIIFFAGLMASEKEFVCSDFFHQAPSFHVKGTVFFKFSDGLKKKIRKVVLGIEDFEPNSTIAPFMNDLSFYSSRFALNKDESLFGKCFNL